MHILEEWRINDIERKAELSASRLYELDTLHSDVANLERADGDIRSLVDGLRYEIQAAQVEIAQLAACQAAYELVVKDCNNLTEKVIPNIKAESQAREKMLRDALEECYRQMVCLVPDAEIRHAENMAKKALAQPTDDTALKAAIQHGGCLNCGPRPSFFPPAGVIGVGFGYAGLHRDGEPVWTEPNEPESDDDYMTGAKAEELAAADPDHDWRIVMDGPLSGRTYQRHAAGEWALIEQNQGFA